MRERVKKKEWGSDRERETCTHKERDRERERERESKKERENAVAACQHRENVTPLWFLCLSALAEGKK